MGVLGELGIAKGVELRVARGSAWMWTSSARAAHLHKLRTNDSSSGQTELSLLLYDLIEKGKKAKINKAERRARLTQNPMRFFPLFWVLDFCRPVSSQWSYCTWRPWCPSGLVGSEADTRDDATIAWPNVGSFEENGSACCFELEGDWRFRGFPRPAPYSGH